MGQNGPRGIVSTQRQRIVTTTLTDLSPITFTHHPPRSDTGAMRINPASEPRDLVEHSCIAYRYLVTCLIGTHV